MSFEKIRRLRGVPQEEVKSEIIPVAFNRVDNPGISVIIPCGGNDPVRERNFKYCLQSIADQTYTNYEVIVIEQSLDGSFYKEWCKDFGIGWKGIKDPLDRGFNLSWCRNVGAREAKGTQIILLDSDMCFDVDYFKEISKNKSGFAGGASMYHWIREEKVTRIYENNKNFAGVYSFGAGRHIDPVFRFKPFVDGNGYGAVLIFNREWYWESFGGYPEDFFKYGWEDKAAVEIIKYALGIPYDSAVPLIDYNVIHLSHSNKDYNNMKSNESLYNWIKNCDKKTWIDKAKMSKLGNINSPAVLINLK
jgi:glycosyltransferase involved in cell wall biosynthesis